MDTCKRGSLVEVKGEVMTEGEYLRRQSEGDTRPHGYEIDLIELKPCREVKDPEPDEDDGLGM